MIIFKLFTEILYVLLCQEGDQAPVLLQAVAVEVDQGQEVAGDLHGEEFRDPEV